MDNIHLQLSNVIGPLLAESQSHLMIEDVHHLPIAIFRTLLLRSRPPESEIEIEFERTWEASELDLEMVWTRV